MSESSGELVACWVCERCGRRSVAHAPLCAACGHGALTRTAASPLGTVVDVVPVGYPPDNLKALGPYASVLVRLDDGCELFGIVLGDARTLAAGARVTAVRKDVLDGQGPFFEWS